MYQLNIDVRGDSIVRYVAHFHAASGSYFSVEIEGAHHKDAYKTILDDHKKYSVEVCVIKDVSTMTHYELLRRDYLYSQNLLTYLGKLLVNAGTVPEGTPIEICFEQHGIHYSFILMNAGLEHAA